MSAAEKLKALIHKAETEDYGWDNDMIGEPLVRALPQIVAVVEAAEAEVPERFHYDDPLASALATLDEALT